MDNMLKEYIEKVENLVDTVEEYEAFYIEVAPDDETRII